MSRYWFFADRFGWTPTQVDEQPVLHLQALRDIGVAHDEVRAQAQRDAQRKAAHGG